VTGTHSRDRRQRGRNRRSPGSPPRSTGSRECQSQGGGGAATWWRHDCCDSRRHHCGRAPPPRYHPLTMTCPACGRASNRTRGSAGAAPVQWLRRVRHGPRAPTIACRSCGTPVAGLPHGPGSPRATPDPRPPSTASGSRARSRRCCRGPAGFTSLNESTDPELVQALVTRAFDRLSAEVTRYEGTVEKFAGDAILAVFGVPVVHEDDAERAVRAALEMQSAYRAAADLRAPRAARAEPAHRRVETGEVLVDIGRAGTERDRMVTGDPVNTAARLQSVAAPGQIVSAQHLCRHPRAGRLRRAAAHAPRGKALPSPRRAVLRRARRGIRPALGMEAPLIGRDEEIGSHKETVRRTVADGRPHRHRRGQRGVGKSRPHLGAGEVPRRPARDPTGARAAVGLCPVQLQRPADAIKLGRPHPRRRRLATAAAVDARSGSWAAGDPTLRRGCSLCAPRHRAGGLHARTCSTHGAATWG
jgi:class 3 adenylate cyclase